MQMGRKTIVCTNIYRGTIKGKKSRLYNKVEDIILCQRHYVNFHKSELIYSIHVDGAFVQPLEAESTII